MNSSRNRQTSPGTELVHAPCELAALPRGTGADPERLPFGTFWAGVEDQWTFSSDLLNLSLACRGARHSWGAAPSALAIWGL